MADKPHSNFAPTRIFSNVQIGLIWFGAAVSLAEILTGTFFASLGWQQGLAAIVIGHLIGCVLFWGMSYASARSGRSAMEMAAASFGVKGLLVFSVANVVQLIGWTAIMIASGAAAAIVLVPAFGLAGWALCLGALIVVWVALGPAVMGRVQSIAAAGLFILTILVSFAIFATPSTEMAVVFAGDPITFGAAVELAAAMPLSWLPVAGDYLRQARRPRSAALTATITYGAGSCWMFAIGLGLALFAGSSDITAVLSQIGWGVVGLLIVVFSTVTTTFLDAESAGISAAAIYQRIPARTAGIVAALIGMLLAIAAPVATFEPFLYLIGSIFAPMAAIVCVDRLIIHRTSDSDVFESKSEHSGFNALNMVLWLAGFVLYRVSLSWDIPVGNTLPVMIIIAFTTWLAHQIYQSMQRSTDA